MNRDFRSVIAWGSAKRKRVWFAILCGALLMLVSATMWAESVSDPCLAAGAPSVCGVTITIGGVPGALTAIIAGGGPNTSYDAADDQIVGIINNSTATIGAIRLSSPLAEIDNLFQFDGDGPACWNFQTDQFNYSCTVTDPTDYVGPQNVFEGISADFTTGTILFTTPIPPNGTAWTGMENTPTTVVSIGETQQLVLNVTNNFSFGPFVQSEAGTFTEQSNGDDFQFTPVGGVTGPDYWTFLPIPVCAGPAGESPFGPFTGTPAFGFSTGDFGIEAPSNCLPYGPAAFVTNFGPVASGGFGSLPFPNQNSLACTPYLDYSSAGNPQCVELERDCSGPDCTSQSLQWTARIDYDIDANSIAGPIGGPAVLFAPGLPGPTSPNAALPYAASPTDFSVNAITAYTGANPGEDPPPAKAGGSDGKSVFVSAFSPAQSETNPVPPGVTVGFPGFEIPSSDITTPSCSKESAPFLLFPSGKLVTETVPAVNCLLALPSKKGPVPIPWVLLWDYTTTSNTPITNLQLCPSVTGGTCNTPGVSAPWVHLSLVPVSGCGSFTGQNPLSGEFANLSFFFPGQYTFVWNPVNNPTGCQVAPVMQFSNGTFTSPATFVYSF